MNALSLIALTAGGMTISFSDVHSQNASWPISSNSLLRLTIVNCEHRKNAFSLINLTAGVIKISCSDVQCANAPSPISSSPSQPFTRAILVCPVPNRLDGWIDYYMSHVPRNITITHFFPIIHMRDFWFRHLTSPFIVRFRSQASRSKRGLHLATRRMGQRRQWQGRMRYVLHAFESKGLFGFSQRGAFAQSNSNRLVSSRQHRISL